jgi:hypothetical protein
MDAAYSTEPPAPSRQALLLAALLYALAFIPILLWPTDVMWLIDEPRLLANAWHGNNSHEMVVQGLNGNFGLPYSPVPTQIYQLILACTHNPAGIVILHALLTGGLIAIALFWLARTLRLPPWFGAAFLIVPYVSLQQRVLWDATFTLPFGMLALAGLASFLRTGGKWPLRLAFVFSVQVFIVHPQALPLGIPILAFLFWRHWPALRADSRGLLYTTAVLAVCHAKYVFIAMSSVWWRYTHGGGASYPGGKWEISMLAPFMGGNLLNGYDHSTMLATSPVSTPGDPAQIFAQAPWLLVAMWVTRLVYPFIWLGIIVAVARAPRIWRGWRAKTAGLPIADQIATIALGGLVFQFLLYTATRIPLGPQYYFGTFALHAFFAWLGVAFIHRWLAGKIAAIAFVAASAVVTVCNLHHSHYGLDERPHWPSMADCERLVHDLNGYSDEMAYIMADDPKKANRTADGHVALPDSGLTFLYRFPQSLRTMRLLLPPTPGVPQKFSGRLLLTYAEKDGHPTGRMILTEFTGPTPPPQAQTIPISPLPKDWIPDPSTWDSAEKALPPVQPADGKAGTVPAAKAK